MKKITKNASFLLATAALVSLAACSSNKPTATAPDVSAAGACQLGALQIKAPEFPMPIVYLGKPIKVAPGGEAYMGMSLNNCAAATLASSEWDLDNDGHPDVQVDLDGDGIDDVVELKAVASYSGGPSGVSAEGYISSLNNLEAIISSTTTSPMLRQIGVFKLEAAGNALPGIANATIEAKYFLGNAVTKVPVQVLGDMAKISGPDTKTVTTTAAVTKNFQMTFIISLDDPSTLDPMAATAYFDPTPGANEPDVTTTTCTYVPGTSKLKVKCVVDADTGTTAGTYNYDLKLDNAFATTTLTLAKVKVVVL